jgi:hypothetical protein
MFPRLLLILSHPFAKVFSFIVSPSSEKFPFRRNGVLLFNTTDKTHTQKLRIQYILSKVNTDRRPKRGPILQDRTKSQRIYHCTVILELVHLPGG